MKPKNWRSLLLAFVVSAVAVGFLTSCDYWLLVFPPPTEMMPLKLLPSDARKRVFSLKDMEELQPGAQHGLTGALLFGRNDLDRQECSVERLDLATLQWETVLTWAFSPGGGVLMVSASSDGELYVPISSEHISPEEHTNALFIYNVRTREISEFRFDETLAGRPAIAKNFLYVAVGEGYEKRILGVNLYSGNSHFVRIPVEPDYALDNYYASLYVPNRNEDRLDFEYLGRDATTPAGVFVRGPYEYDPQTDSFQRLQYPGGSRGPNGRYIWYDQSTWRLYATPLRQEVAGGYFALRHAVKEHRGDSEIIVQFRDRNALYYFKDISPDRRFALFDRGPYRDRDIGYAVMVDLADPEKIYYVTFPGDTYHLRCWTKWPL